MRGGRPELATPPPPVRKQWLTRGGAKAAPAGGYWPTDGGYWPQHLPAPQASEQVAVWPLLRFEPHRNALLPSCATCLSQMWSWMAMAFCTQNGPSRTACSGARGTALV